MRSLGDAVLDQRIVAGVGNIYKSEGLFLGQIDPRRPAANASGTELARLWDVLIPPMRAGVERHGRTTYFRPGCQH